ncbi:glycine/sarcosine/betaine reductase component B subunit [Anaerococcus cruorum]|uniref:glycine/sarcosine/betaine reductase component B subunit n=1 Tax=Anaerococcus sp. WGS1596 TaxID=3366806 RepID=UPI00372CEDDE
MGFGPSTKMTTMHHYRCPIVNVVSSYDGLEFVGVIAKGVSDKQVDKERTSVETGKMAKELGLDAAIVALDGWGNHHIDFTSVIGELEKNGVATAGLSFIGQQATFVATNEYVDLVLDYNKTESGFETQVLGENSLTEIDAMKAMVELSKKMAKRGKKWDKKKDPNEKKEGKLTKDYIDIKEVRFGDTNKIDGHTLVVDENIAGDALEGQDRIIDMSVDIIKPGDYKKEANTNLDIMPIAAKKSGKLGEGETVELRGVVAMITGVEEAYDLQPANMGSCDGTLEEKISFDRAGTPSVDDYIFHIDFTFKEGEGRTADGIITAHKIADEVIGKIREILKSYEGKYDESKDFYNIKRPGKYKIGIVKVVSGVGCMYDTFVKADEPAGIIGGENMRLRKNSPVFLTPNEARDGGIHSLY